MYGVHFNAPVVNMDSYSFVHTFVVQNSDNAYMVALWLTLTHQCKDANYAEIITKKSWLNLTEGIFHRLGFEGGEKEAYSCLRV